MKLVFLICSALVCIHVAATSVQAQTCEPPNCFVNGTEEILCIRCPTGWGVAVVNRDFMECRSSPTPRNTKCEECIGGVNFSDTNNPTSKCVACLSCHSTKEVQTKQCTIDSDAVCACINGSYYLDPGLDSCVPCRECGAGEVEIVPCTAIQDRECGVQSKPDPTTPKPTTPTPIFNTTSPTGISTDHGTSSESPTKGTGISAGYIVLIVLAIILLLVVLVLLGCLYSHYKNIGDSSQNNNSSTPCCLINITDCCIASQENNYDSSRSGHSQSNGQVHMNGNVARYHQVPPDQEPNGSVRQNHATGAMDEVELKRSEIRNALDLSTTKLDQLIIELDETDGMGRNALGLADRYLDLPPESLNNGMRAVDVLHLWVQKHKTKEQLVEALKEMRRNDIEELLMEDSAES